MKTSNTKAKRKETVIEQEMVEAKREWRNLLKFGDENHLLFGAFIIVLCCILAVNVLYILSQHSGDNRPVQTNSIRKDFTYYATSNQIISNDVITTSIKNVTENNKKDMAFTIDPSETMLILDVRVTNKTTEIQHLLPSIQFYVRSNEGDYVSLHASMYVTNPIPAKDLKPGETVSGQVSFNVPKNLARPLLYVDTGWDDSAPVIFDVLH